MTQSLVKPETGPAPSGGYAPPHPSRPAIVPTIAGLVRENGVWAVIVVALSALAIYDGGQAWVSVVFVAENLLQIAPFLLLAIGLAAYAKATGADGLIARVFSGHLGLMIVLAAAFGGLSPFCSCGVIPLIAALLSMGVPLPAVMAFWLASPIMDPSMFVLTTATLGLPFAIGKTVAAVGIGLMGGYVTWALQAGGHFAEPLRPGVGNGGCAGAKVRAPKAAVWRFWKDAARVATFRGELISSALFLGKWLTLAFLIESLMLAYVPADWIARALGADSLWAIPAAVAVGVPAYLNGYAALPLVSGLIDMGVTPGAGMAFLVAGGVTSIPAAIAVFALVKRPVFMLYLGLALAGGALAGIGYQIVS